MKDARRRVRVGRELRSMPAVEGAWLAGDVGEPQVDVLARVRRRVGGAAFDPDEASLVGHARSLRFGDFFRVVAY